MDVNCYDIEMRALVSGQPAFVATCLRRSEPAMMAAKVEGPILALESIPMPDYSCDVEVNVQQAARSLACTGHRSLGTYLPSEEQRPCRSRSLASA